MRPWATIEDLARTAKQRLPGFVFDFLEGGAGDDGGVQRNAARVRALQLMPSYLTGLNRNAVDTSVTVLGKRYAQPFGIAPTGMNAMIWPGGDQFMAAAARDMDIPLVNSTMASASVEQVAAIAPGNIWFQLYTFTDEKVNADIVARSEAAGVDVFVMTVDTTSTPNRNRDTRNRFGSAFHFDTAKAMQMALRPHWLWTTMRAGEPAPLNLRPYGNANRGVRKREPMGKLIKTHADWEDVRRLRERWKGKLVLKGLMSADDAVRAASVGCDAVWISNHGGRVLESAPATIDCLPPMVEALGGRAEILIDGGFNSGEDVVKALALGANMVFLGRGPLFGLAAAAEAGVRRALDIYKSDVHRTMLHIGSPNVASLRERDIVLRPGDPLPSASRGPTLKATA